VPAQTPAPSQLNHSNFRSSLSLANSSYSSRQAIEADNSWSFLRQSLSVRQPDFKRSNLSYDGARCSTPSVKTQWMSDLSLGRILNLEEARTTRRSYAKLRDASRPHYSHSIIADKLSWLICQHNFSSLTDKCRRYTRRNFLVLNSQKNLRRLRFPRFRHRSVSIE
jgi:hypothetical protein